MSSSGYANLATTIFLLRGTETSMGDSNTPGNSARWIPTVGQAWNSIKNVAITFGRGVDNVEKASAEALKAARAVGASIYTSGQGSLVGNFAEELVVAAEKTIAKGGIVAGLLDSVKFVGQYINPFIGLASLYKVFTAEEGEKTRTAVTEGSGFGAMWLGEKLAKATFLGKFGFSSAASKIVSLIFKSATVATPWALFTRIAVDSLLFAGVSIGSWIAASTLAKKVYDDVTGRTQEDAKLAEKAKQMESAENPFAEKGEGQLPDSASGQKEMSMDEICMKQQQDFMEQQKQYREQMQAEAKESIEKMHQAQMEEIQAKNQNLIDSLPA